MDTATNQLNCCQDQCACIDTLEAQKDTSYDLPHQGKKSKA